MIISYFERVTACERALKKLAIQRDLTRAERIQIAIVLNDLLDTYRQSNA